MTQTQTLHRIQSESGTTDDLATFTMNESRFAVVTAASGHTITIKHGTGNIRTYSASDLTLSDSQSVMLWRIGSIVMCIGGGAAVPLPIAQGGTNGITALAGFNNLSPLTTKGDILTRDGTNNVRKGVGTDNFVVKADSSQSDGLRWGHAYDYILVRDEKAANTAGGGFTAGAWRTRDLNTEVEDTGNYASIASNQITLEAGTYRCRISAPARLVDRHKARLQNITDGTTILLGTSEFSNGDATTQSVIQGRFTLSEQKVLEVQHQCQTTVATNGFGVESNFGVTEVYTVVELWRE